MIPSSIRQISCELFEVDGKSHELLVAEFVQCNLAALIPAGADLVTLDGFDGVGKSTIGKALAAQVGAALVGLDSFLNEDRGVFLEELRFDEIASAIDVAVQAGKRVVVEGCMVDEVLRRVGRRAGFRIYLMRISRTLGVEFDSIDKYDELYGDKSAEELIAEEEETARKAAELPEWFGNSDGKVPSLDIELIRYHRQVRPHDTADVIVKIVRVG